MLDNEQNKPLTDKQKQFCEEYLIDKNATQAAIRSGYSPKTAYSIGAENLKKPQIREYIDKVLTEQSLGRGETLKAISDIARASLNDYFKLKKVIKRPKVVKHLSEIIADLQNECEDAEKLMSRISPSDDQ